MIEHCSQARQVWAGLAGLECAQARVDYGLGYGLGYGPGYGAGYGGGYAPGYGGGYGAGYALGYGPGYAPGYGLGYALGSLCRNPVGDRVPEQCAPLPPFRDLVAEFAQRLKQNPEGVSNRT